MRVKRSVSRLRGDGVEAAKEARNTKTLNISCNAIFGSPGNSGTNGRRPTRAAVRASPGPDDYYMYSTISSAMTNTRLGHCI